MGPSLFIQLVGLTATLMMFKGKENNRWVSVTFKE